MFSKLPSLELLPRSGVPPSTDELPSTDVPPTTEVLPASKVAGWPFDCRPTLARLP